MLGGSEAAVLVPKPGPHHAALPEVVPVDVRRNVLVSLAQPAPSALPHGHALLVRSSKGRKAYKEPDLLAAYELSTGNLIRFPLIFH